MPFPEKKIPEEWEYKNVMSLAKGINLSLRPDKLEDEELITGRNILIQKGRLQGDTGYKDFGDGVAGIPQADFQFSKSTGVVELVLITTVTFMRYNETHSQWDYVSSGVSTLANGGEASGAVAVTVDSIVGFSDGDLIGINLDNGQQHKAVVDGAPAGSDIAFLPAVPVGRTIADNAPVVKAVDLSGDLDFHVVGVTVPSHDVFVFTNGVDLVKRYDGADCITVPGLPGSGVSCKTLTLYNNSLFLINTVESGTAHPRRVRRSNAADYTDWTTGTAGFDDLFEDEDPLLGTELLGPYMIIYAEREIIRGEYIGTGGINYKFETMVRGEGIISTMGVADVGDAHYVMCQSNIYAYRGGFDLEPAGDKVYHKLFGQQGEINPSFKNRCFAFYVEELDEVWFFYPSTGSENCDRLVRYNVGDQTWAERRFATAFVGFGFYQSSINRAWSALVGSWLAQTWKWNDRSVTANSPTTHLMPATEGAMVQEYDYLSTLDNATPITYTVETKDFLSPDGFQRFDMLEMQIRGDNISVVYSTDGGISFETLGTVSRGTLGRARLFKQFVFDKIRFRFTGESSDFQLGEFGFSFKEESLY